MNQNLRKAWKDFFERNVSGDTWFVTTHFVFGMALSTQKKRIRIFLGRIEQSLKDLGHISFSNRPSEGLWAIVVHSPANTHAHLLVGAPGLSNLETGRWEERWKDIMSHRGQTATCVIYTAWGGTNGAASYITKSKNLADESEIWFRGIVPRTSAEQARK